MIVDVDIAARAGLSPNSVTLVGALLCLGAFYFFWEGRYWAGSALGFGFMVLDTVDGKLARCTGASSEWGNVFDHGIDLIHPVFWWWAWLHGLEAYGTPLEPIYATMLLWAIVGGYVRHGWNIGGACVTLPGRAGSVSCWGWKGVGIEDCSAPDSRIAEQS